RRSGRPEPHGRAPDPAAAPPAAPRCAVVPLRGRSGGEPVPEHARRDDAAHDRQADEPAHVDAREADPRPPRGGRMTRRTGRTAAALGVAVVLTALGACAPEIPTPEPPAAPAAPGPVLDEEQEAKILDAIGTTLAKTQEARSAKGLGERLTGPARAIRESE